MLVVTELLVLPLVPKQNQTKSMLLSFVIFLFEFSVLEYYKRTPHPSSIKFKPFLSFSFSHGCVHTRCSLMCRQTHACECAYTCGSAGLYGECFLRTITLCSFYFGAALSIKPRVCSTANVPCLLGLGMASSSFQG